MEGAASEFLHHLRIPVSKRYFRQLVQAHPEYPSLLSVSDTFYRLGLEHTVHRVDESALIDLPYPYLLPLDKGREHLLCIKSERDLERVKKELREHWNGVVLQADAFNKAKSKTNSFIYSLEREMVICLMGVFILLFSLLFLTQTQAEAYWLASGLLFSTLSGVCLSYFLMNKALGGTSTTIDSFCNAGKNNSCDRILTSGVRFLGIEFSDLVTCYFVSQFVVLMLALLSIELYKPFIVGLSMMSTVSMPFVLFSWYYQKYIAKTWCRLCLIVSGILLVQWLMFAAAWRSHDFQLSVQSVSDAALFSLIFLCTSLLVLMLKRALLYYIKLKEIGGRANRVLHAPEVFLPMLKSQRLIDNTPFENELILGEADAPIRIIMATNLYCRPCKDAHQVIEELLAAYPGKVAVALRFVKAGTDVQQDLSSVGYLLSYWVTNIRGMSDAREETAKMMRRWFEVWDLKEFSKEYPLTDQDYNLSRLLEHEHYGWIDQNNISLTPTFFINGYQLPPKYHIQDLLDITLSLVHAVEQDRQATLIE